MSDRTTDMSAGMLRQRRNLLGISVFMPIYLYSGAKMYKISFLGNEAKIENPEIITYSLIAMFLYFLLRYYQYFNEERGVIEFRAKMDDANSLVLKDLIADKVKKNWGPCTTQIVLKICTLRII